MKRLSPLAVLISLLAWSRPMMSQQPPIPAPSPNALSNELNNMYQDMRNHNPGSTHATLDASQDGEVCKLTLTLYNDAGQVVDYKSDVFVWPCKDLPQLQLVPYITNRAAPKKEPSNPYFFGIPFFGGGPIIPVGTSAMPADATPADTRASGSAGSRLLDLPLAPPFSAGLDATAAGGCDPSDSFFAFRVNHDADTVTRINGCPLQLGPQITVTSRPLQAAVTPDNSTVLVTSYDNAITFIDVATNQVTFTLRTPVDVFPSGIAISENGRLAYITSFIDVNPSLLVIDLKNHSIAARVSLPYSYPQSVFLTPDETQLFVTFPLANAVSILDVSTLTVSASLAVPSPYSVAFQPSGTRVYIDSGTSPGKVIVLDMATNQALGSYAVPAGPAELQVSADGRFLAALSFASDTLSYIDLLTGSATSGKAGSIYSTSLAFLQ